MENRYNGFRSHIAEHPKPGTVGENFKTTIDHRLKRKMGQIESEFQLKFEQRLQIERLLLKISTRFINLPVDQIDKAIEDAQRRICELFDLDRSTLWHIIGQEPRALLLTHFHYHLGDPSHLGGPPLPDRMDLEKFFPWVAQKLLDGETVAIPKTIDLPPEAARDRGSFRTYGVKSHLSVPLSVGEGPVFGVLAFSAMRAERSWSETEQMIFKLFAQVIANALARKQVEDTLRENETKLNLATVASRAGFWIMDSDSGYVWVTPRTRELLLFAPDEKLNYENIFKAVHPEDRVRIYMVVQQTLQSGENFFFDFRAVRPDGSLRWISARGQQYGKVAEEPIRILGLFLDITERKQVEDVLQERLRFEKLLSELSARFVNITNDRVDTEIEGGLRQILEFFQFDRCSLLRILPDKASWQITHIVSSGHVPPYPAGTEFPRSLFPWAYDKLTKQNEAVFISKLDDLPAEANVDRQSCIEWGICSYYNIPILVDDSCSHVIHINTAKSGRSWSEELFSRLRLVGEIFINALVRKQREETLRENARLLRENENELRGLAGKLIYVQEEERSRIARELHDDLGQRLTAFSIDLGRLEKKLLGQQAPLQESLREMKNAIVGISEDAHNLSRQLHPSVLDDLGLIKAVKSECASFSRREGTEVVFNHENIPRVISKDLSLSLYRIVQEGLNNISKHACAEHISVSLTGTDHVVVLSIQDNGVGFDWEEVKRHPGLGFSSMRERARFIGGEFFISTELEKGTTITVKAPLTTEGEWGKRVFF